MFSCSVPVCPGHNLKRSAVAHAVACISVLLAANGTVYAQQHREEAQASDEKLAAQELAVEQRMDPVEVRSTSLESRTYSRQEMDATAKGNRDLTSLIAEHPAVRLNPSMDGSGNRGSTWKPKQVKGLTLNVEILNLLNRMPAIAAANPLMANNLRYQTGREIWLTAGYQF